MSASVVLAWQLAADRAADFHPFVGGKRFRLANTHDHKAAGRKPMRGQNFDDALSLALESSDFNRFGDRTPRRGVELFEMRRQPLPLRRKINDGGSFRF